MREERVSADLLALNDLVQDRVQRAGAIFVDIWPGFVDSENRYDGQVTRLRTSGVGNFTPAGGRKAAHFVDLELKQLLAARDTAVSGAPGGEAVNVSLPTINEPPRPRERPLVGPVLPLTNAPSPGGVSPLATPACRLTRW